MEYTIHGPFEMPEQQNGLIDRRAPAKREFWDAVDEADESVSSACGCYLFAIRAARGIKPYYVGLADSQSFRQECFGSHKVNIYNDVLADRHRGTPILILIARRTHGGRFSKPSGNGRKDVAYLESMLIGAAIKKNSRLMNISRTRFLRGLVVPSFINSERRRPTHQEQEFRTAIGQ